MPKLVKLWFTPKFPDEHIRRILAYRPEGRFSILRNFYRTWFVHPIKRRAAKYYLWLLRTFFGLRVFAVTGSTGKTTTKEMLASILGRKGKTVYSLANIDPIFNIPTTILRCATATKFLILEMGVEYPGEMDFYLWLVKPDFGIITNIYPTHTLFFKNVQGVANEKTKLVRFLSHRSRAILHSNDRYLSKLKGKLNSKICWFGKGSNVNARNVKTTSDFKTKFDLDIDNSHCEVLLPAIGTQFVEDAIAAAAAAHAAGIPIEDIKRGLETFSMQEHRMHVYRLKSGATLIDDSYNNNPEAAKKAIELLKNLAGKRKTLLVFGDMLELGKKQLEYHRQVGEFAKSKKIDYIVGVGKLSKGVASNIKYSAKDWQEALPMVKTVLKEKPVILVKGSRSMGLDCLVSALLQKK